MTISQGHSELLCSSPCYVACVTLCPESAVVGAADESYCCAEVSESSSTVDESYCCAEVS